jgi:pilus assembly protein Flp/PilA
MSRFFKNDSGATAIEYALIASLITVGVITALTSIGTTLNGTFNSITAALP